MKNSNDFTWKLKTLTFRGFTFSLIALTATTAAAGTRLFTTYAPDPTTYNSYIYDVSIDTGSITQGISIGTQYFGGLTFDRNGQLFAASSTLDRIDINTGQVTVIGTLPDFMNSITFTPDGNIMAFSSYSGTLYRIDPTSGKTLSSTYIQYSGTIVQSEIASDSAGTLFTVGYNISLGKSVLTTVNSNSGITTDIGQLVASASTPAGFVPGGSLTYASQGRFFATGGGGPGRRLFEINSETLTFNFIGFSGISPPCVCYDSLASLTTPVPESSSYALFLAGIGALFFAVRRKIRAAD